MNRKSLILVIAVVILAFILGRVTTPTKIEKVIEKEEITVEKEVVKEVPIEVFVEVPKDIDYKIKYKPGLYTKVSNDSKVILSVDDYGRINGLIIDKLNYEDIYLVDDETKELYLFVPGIKNEVPDSYRLIEKDRKYEVYEPIMVQDLVVGYPLHDEIISSLREVRVNSTAYNNDLIKGKRDYINEISKVQNKIILDQGTYGFNLYEKDGLEYTTSLINFDLPIGEEIRLVESILNNEAKLTDDVTLKTYNEHTFGSYIPGFYYNVSDPYLYNDEISLTSSFVAVDSFSHMNACLVEEYGAKHYDSSLNDLIVDNQGLSTFTFLDEEGKEKDVNIVKEGLSFQNLYYFKDYDYLANPLVETLKPILDYANVLEFKYDGIYYHEDSKGNFVYLKVVDQKIDNLYLDQYITETNDYVFKKSYLDYNLEEKFKYVVVSKKDDKYYLASDLDKTIFGEKALEKGEEITLSEEELLTLEPFSSKKTLRLKESAINEEYLKLEESLINKSKLDLAYSEEYASLDLESIRSLLTEVTILTTSTKYNLENKLTLSGEESKEVLGNFKLADGTYLDFEINPNNDDSLNYLVVFVKNGLITDILFDATNAKEKNDYYNSLKGNSYFNYNDEGLLALEKYKYKESSDLEDEVIFLDADLASFEEAMRSIILKALNRRFDYAILEISKYLEEELKDSFIVSTKDEEDGKLVIEIADELRFLDQIGEYEIDIKPSTNVKQVDVSYEDDTGELILTSRNKYIEKSELLSFELEYRYKDKERVTKEYFAQVYSPEKYKKHLLNLKVDYKDVNLNLGEEFSNFLDGKAINLTLPNYDADKLRLSAEDNKNLYFTVLDIENLNLSLDGDLYLKDGYKISNNQLYKGEVLNSGRVDILYHDGKELYEIKASDDRITEIKNLSKDIVVSLENFLAKFNTIKNGMILNYGNTLKFDLTDEVGEFRIRAFYDYFDQDEDLLNSYQKGEVYRDFEFKVLSDNEVDKLVRRYSFPYYDYEVRGTTSLDLLEYKDFEINDLNFNLDSVEILNMPTTWFNGLEVKEPLKAKNDKNRLIIYNGKENEYYYLEDNQIKNELNEVVDEVSFKFGSNTVTYQGSEAISFLKESSKLITSGEGDSLQVRLSPNSIQTLNLKYKINAKDYDYEIILRKLNSTELEKLIKDQILVNFKSFMAISELAELPNTSSLESAIDKIDGIDYVEVIAYDIYGNELREVDLFELVSDFVYGMEEGEIKEIILGFKVNYLNPNSKEASLDFKVKFNVYRNESELKG